MNFKVNLASETKIILMISQQHIPYNLTHMKEIERAIPCFTCGKVNFFSPMIVHDITEYEKQIECGNWRVGKWIYTPCDQCPQRLCRIQTDIFVQKYLKEDLTPKPKSITKWSNEYKDIYQSLTLEFMTADTVHADVLNLYTQSTDVEQVSIDQFYLDYCTSPIGFVDAKTIAQLNAKEFSLKPRGSFFVIIKSRGIPVVALLLDACTQWLGFKSFWYNDIAQHQNKPIMVKLCWFKVFEIAKQLQYPHVQLSIFDPSNTRLLYKLNYSDMLEVNALNNGVWLPINKLMNVIVDGHNNRRPENLELYLDNIQHHTRIKI